MKKKITVAALMAFTFLPNAMGQGFVKQMMSHMYAGVKAEGNTSNFLLSDMDGMKSNLGYGGGIGGYLGLRLSSHFAIQEDFLVYYRSSTFEQKQTLQETDFENIGAQMAFYAMYKKNVGAGKLNIGVGPYAEYGLWARNKQGTVETNLYKKNEDGDAALKRFNVGAAMTVGYEFKFGLQVNASYKLGVLNSLNKPTGDAAMRPSMVSVGIGYSIFK